MAILKHISSKNANYGDAEKYLTFEHDEFTMKPTLDADGRLIPRVDYRISSLNCGGEDFAVACMRSNLRYGKNQKREDVKSHHFCATTSTMRPTGGTSPWRKAASSPTWAMCGTPGTASMSITMVITAASRRNTG